MDLRKNMLLHLHAQRVNEERLSVIPHGTRRERPAAAANRVVLSSYISPTGPPPRRILSPSSPNSIPSPIDSPLRETDARRAADEKEQEDARELFIFSLREKLAHRFAKSRQRRLGIKPTRQLKYDEARINDTRQLMDDLQYLRDTAENERADQHWLRLQVDRQREDKALREREETKHRVVRLADYVKRRFSQSAAKSPSESLGEALAEEDVAMSGGC